MMKLITTRLRGGLAPVAAVLMLTGILCLSAAASAAASAGATQVVPRSTQNCGLSVVGEKLGPTYVEKLKVVNVSCSAGDSLVKAYNSCRLKHGGAKGKCTVTVDGYRCSEKRYTGSPDQFIAAATCTKSRDAVDFTYTEDT